MRPLTAALIILAGATSLPAQTHEDTDQELTMPAETVPEGLAASDVAKSVELVIADTNSFRREEEIQPPLRVNEQLTATAQEFADFMARTDQYGHHADDRTPAERATAQNYEYCLIAENIAYQYNSAGFTVEELANGFVQGWQESPGHRKNMLEPAAIETGVAIARSSQTGNYYAVQLFGRPKSEQIAFQVGNQSDAKVSYRIGERSFTLPAGYTREHRQCTHAELTILADATGVEESPSFRIRNGARYAIQSAGEVQIEEFKASSDATDSSIPTP